MTAAALLLAAICTLGAWQGWAMVRHMDAGHSSAYGSGVAPREPADREYPTQYAGDGAAESGYGQGYYGYYGWSYLLASPVAAPLVTARTAVDDDPGR